MKVFHILLHECLSAIAAWVFLFTCAHCLDSRINLWQWFVAATSRSILYRPIQEASKRQKIPTSFGKPSCGPWCSLRAYQRKPMWQSENRPMRESHQQTILPYRPEVAPCFYSWSITKKIHNSCGINRADKFANLNKLLSLGSLDNVVLLWITKIVICNFLQLQLLCDLEGQQFRRQIRIAQIWARYPTKTHSIWMLRHHHHYNCASAHCSPYLRI